MLEIGSEFCNADPVGRAKKFFISGRTALDYIIRDILNEYDIKSALLPSYCCHTMIEPFLKNGIKVRFYDVYFDECTGLSADIPEPYENEIFYFMRYFGYKKIHGVCAEQIRKNWDFIIEDKTHSWLLPEKESISDYSFASYRKWFGVSGIALAEKMSGNFSAPLTYKNNACYCELREKAANLKKEFISGNPVDKNEFLHKFNEAENMLEKDYEDYAPTIQAFNQLLSIDTDALKEKRRANASVLLERLNKTDGIRLLFNDIETNDVPLFVPVLLQTERNDLRRFLTENKIYCPVHWPLSFLHEGISERAKTIYGQELSLVCDQRYSEEDMLKIAVKIKEFITRTKQ